MQRPQGSTQRELNPAVPHDDPRPLIRRADGPAPRRRRESRRRDLPPVLQPPHRPRPAPARQPGLPEGRAGGRPPVGLQELLLPPGRRPDRAPRLGPPLGPSGQAHRPQVQRQGRPLPAARRDVRREAAAPSSPDLPSPAGKPSPANRRPTRRRSSATSSSSSSAASTPTSATSSPSTFKTSRSRTSAPPPAAPSGPSTASSSGAPRPPHPPAGTRRGLEGFDPGTVENLRGLDAPYLPPSRPDHAATPRCEAHLAADADHVGGRRPHVAFGNSSQDVAPVLMTPDQARGEFTQKSAAVRLLASVGPNTSIDTKGRPSD